MDELGRILKERRKELGYSIEDVQKALKFTKNAIIDLEDSTNINFDDPLYFKLYLKKYAKFLELDYSELVDHYDVFERTQTIKIPPVNSSKKSSTKRKVKIKTPFYVEHLPRILITLLIFTILFLSWMYVPKVFGGDFFGLRNNNNDISIPKDPEVPDPEEPDTPIEKKEVTVSFIEFTSGEFVHRVENIEYLTVNLEFSGSSWVGLYQEDGTVIEEFQQKDGVKSFDLTKGNIRFNIGDHHKVKIYINGVELVYEKRNQNDYKAYLEVK